jgi:hypothetical protein
MRFPAQPSGPLPIFKLNSTVPPGDEGGDAGRRCGVLA